MADRNESGVPSAQGGNPPIGIHRTPREPRSDGGIHTLPTLRPQIAQEMDKEIIVCTVENFIGAYFPFDPLDKDLIAVESILKHKQLLADNPPRFTLYSERPTKKTWSGPNGETRAYSPLKDIAEAIGSYTYKGANARKRNTLQYRNCQDTKIESDVPGSSHRIDACFTSDREGLLTTRGIVVSMEHKLEQHKRLENNRQVVSSSVQVMNDDVRRMFTFGITIESDLVTLWYHSRSHSAASMQFSFVEKPKLLIKVFMAFLFADDVEMGIDPNIKGPDTDGHYTYTIPQKDGKSSRSYRTVAPISQYRSNNITGRMARIFIVQEINSTSSAQFVLKDVWIDEEAQTESEIQQAIFDDIEEFWRTKSTDPKLEKLKSLHAKIVENKSYKKHFLEIVDDFLGNKSKSVATNWIRTTGLLKTPNLTERSGATISSQTANVTTPSQTANTSSTLDRRSTGTTLSAVVNSNVVEELRRRDFKPRKRYLVVFKEVCTTVGDLVTLGDVVDVLKQVLTPLQLLLCAGWVHRDISSGNVMAYHDNGKWNVKLADLEYARKYPPPPDYKPSSDPKTGTPFFMAHEILDRLQIHAHRVGTVNEDSDNERPDVNNPSARTIRPITIHNFQHDLESVWWILLWTITLRVKDSPLEALAWARTVFQNSDELSRPRRECFTLSIIDKLKAVLKIEVEPLAGAMEWMRDKMHTAYVHREEQGQLKDIGSYVTIHRHFVIFFEDLGKSDLRWRNVSFTKHSPYRDITVAADAAANKDIPARLGVNKRPLPEGGEESKDQESGPKKQGLAARMRPASKRSKRGDGDA